MAFDLAKTAFKGLKPLFHEEEDEVLDAVGVAPFVVVPADDLARIADRLGELGVDDGGERVALEVGADRALRRCNRG